MQQIQCRKCRSLNIIGMRFCMNCGEKFQYSCPKCNNLIETESRYCPTCGVLLDWGTQAGIISHTQIPETIKQQAKDPVETSSETPPVKKGFNLWLILFIIAIIGIAALFILEKYLVR